MHYFRDSTGSIEPIPTTETSIWNDRCVMFLNFELKFGTLFEDPYQRCYPLPSFLLKIVCKEIVSDLENHNGSRGGRRFRRELVGGGWFSNHLPLLFFLSKSSLLGQGSHLSAYVCPFTSNSPCSPVSYNNFVLNAVQCQC